MDIDYLHEFSVLAKHLNFTAAANKLYIAQPTLSKHISLMEKELGISLFTRSKHNVNLTPAGQVVLDACGDILSRYTQMNDSISALKAGVSGQVRLGVLYYAISIYATPVIVKVTKDYPEITIMLNSYQPPGLMNDLYNDNVDIALMYHIDDSFGDMIQYEDIGYDRLVLLVPKTSKFASYKSISIDELSGHTVVLQKQAPRLTEFVQNKVLSKLPSDKISFLMTEHVDTVVPTILSHNAVAITTSQSAPNISSKDTCIIPISDPDMKIMMSYMYKKSANNKSIKTFLQAVREIFS